MAYDRSPKWSNWTVPRGANPVSILRWNAGGIGVDFTGCSGILDIYDGSSTPLISLSTTPSTLGSLALGTSALGTAGNIARQLTLLGVSPATLPKLRYRYQVFITFADGVTVLSPFIGDLILIDASR